MRILVLNGPNLNLLGLREPEIYGRETYADLIDRIHRTASELGAEVTCRQSNHEGMLIDWIQESYGVYDGIVLNPAAYTHTSIALLDALKAVNIPTVEVHISDTGKRESYRQVSYVRQACVKTVMGLGLDGYEVALRYLVSILKD